MARDRRYGRQVGPWHSVQVAVWLIGLGVLVWWGELWPGVLFVLALSLILEAALLRYAPGPVVATQPATPTPPPPEHRLELLPATCPKCGGPVRGSEIKWTGAQSADCGFCGANLPMERA